MAVRMAVKIPRAETVVDGDVVLVDPFSASHGARYVCPECRGDVVWRKAGHMGSDPSADVMRDPCFAHVADDYVARKCGGGAGESQQHRTAKLLVANAIRQWSAGKARQPCFVYRCGCGEQFRRVHVEPVETVVVDSRVRGAGIGGLEPDVFVRRGDKGGAIEVFYRHAIGDDKIEAYRSLAWWVELDVASIVSGSIEWKVRRASWVEPCSRCAAKRAASAAPPRRPLALDVDVDPQMRLRRQLAALPLDVRLGDVCSGCGLHTILDEAARLQFLLKGGDTTCTHCNRTKAHTVAA